LKTIRNFSRALAPQEAARTLLTPEGVALVYRTAPLADRALALITDIGIILAFNFLAIELPLLFVSRADEFLLVLSMFLAFAGSNLYFIFFELRWQGRTPGKRILNLCAISRQGGELSPFMVVSRNVTRVVELLFPFAIFHALSSEAGFFDVVLPVFWLIGVTMLPLWNKDRLRAGDLLSGTIVIAMPKAELLPDLSGDGGEAPGLHYSFTKGQLSVYGSYELHILEEILRRAEEGITLRAIHKAASRVAGRIGAQLPQDPGYGGLKQFLTDFYSAERAFLEEMRLYGRHKASRLAPVTTGQWAPPPPPGRPG
jgi:uncharacterized RDD family membrane protein YckC